MFYRDYHYMYDGWDEPPAPADDRTRRNDERLEKAIDRAHQNAPHRVMFELGLVIAAPLVVAAAVTVLLNLAGIPTGY